MIAAVFLPRSADAQQVFSLDEAVSYAIQNNLDMKAKRLSSKDADWQVKEYWAIGLPQISGNVDYQYFFDIPTQILPDFITPSIDGRLEEYQLIQQTLPLPFSGGIPAQFGTSNNLTAGIQATGLLFDGSFIVGLQAQKMYRELVNTQIGQTERDVRVNVTKSYLNVLIAEQSKSIIDQNLESISRIKNETEEIYKNGFAEKLDVDRMTLSVNNLKSESENLGHLIQAGKLLLKFHMGFPITDSLILTDNIEKLRVLSSADELLLADYRYDDRVEYEVLSKTIEMAGLNVKRHKASYLPTLTAALGYSRALQTSDLFDKDNEWYPTAYAAASLSIPIYDSRDKKSKIERAKIEEEGYIIQRTNFERSMDMEVRTAMINLNNAKRSVTQRESSRQLAEDIYDITVIKLKEGVGSSLEVNQAEIEMLEAQSNYIDALYNLLIATTDLKKALGKI
jgi:outer membrane protein TolC